MNDPRCLDDASSLNRGDDISRELEAMSSQADVEAELAALKGGSPDAIEASETPVIETPVQDTETQPGSAPVEKGQQG